MARSWVHGRTVAFAVQPLLLAALCLATASAVGQEKPAKKDDGTKHQHQLVTRERTAVIAGRELAYEVTTGTLAVKTDDGKPRADMFFIAYTAGDKQQRARRPITFCFNGGPGSSSVWLHLGMLGPRRVKLPADPVAAPPPAGVIDNPYSLLDVTDLVFIDPVSTGFSRPAEGVAKKEFHGYQEDLRSIGEFIYLYLSRFDRWSSPKFLCGESYGTLRAAGLAGHLQSTYNLELNGLVLVSSVIDFQTIRFGTPNDLPYILFLPSYTATAWYHKRLDASLQQKPLKDVLAEVERFATTDYTLALMAGSTLTDEQVDATAQRVALYTGLTPDYVRRANLRISMSRFAKELMRDQDRTAGRFDSRYRGIDRDGVDDTYEYDASAAAVFGAFTSAMNQYLREELEFDREQIYEILTGNVHPWSYSSFTNRYVSATDTLRSAMVKNPHLRVFVANGYYDLATPYFATIYTFNHLGLPKQRLGNVEMAFYEGGHMMYVDEASLKQLRDDLLRFYEKALPAGEPDKQ